MSPTEDTTLASAEPVTVHPAQHIPAADDHEVSLSNEQVAQALQGSASRAKAAAEMARAARRAAVSANKAEKTPRSERSPRVADIESLAAPTYGWRHIVGPHQAALNALNESIKRIGEDIRRNPSWVRATHDETNTRLASPDELLSQDPEVAFTKGVVSAAESELRRSLTLSDEWRAKPGWLRQVQDFLFDTGARLEADVRTASDRLAASSRSASELEQERLQYYKSTAAERNAQILDRAREARALRENLEAPLREARLERGMAQDILSRGLNVKPLRDAPSHEVLEYVGIRADRSLSYLEFRSAAGVVYRSDPSRVPGDQAPVPGDKFQHTQAPDGRGSLHILEKSPHLNLDQGPLEGRLGATHWEGPKLRSFELTDAQGNTRSVVPTRGDDLLRELRCDFGKAMVAGNQLRIQQREIHVLERPRSHGLER